MSLRCFCKFLSLETVEDKDKSQEHLIRPQPPPPPKAGKQGGQARRAKQGGRGFYSLPI